MFGSRQLLRQFSGSFFATQRLYIKKDTDMFKVVQPHSHKALRQCLSAYALAEKHFDKNNFSEAKRFIDRGISKTWFLDGITPLIVGFRISMYKFRVKILVAAYDDCMSRTKLLSTELSQRYRDALAESSPRTAQQACDRGAALMLIKNEAGHCSNASDALQAFKQALTMEPDFLAAKLGAAKVYAMLGESKKSAELMRSINHTSFFANISTGSTLTPSPEDNTDHDNPHTTFSLK